jgi:hypothetical protein
MTHKFRPETWTVANLKDFTDKAQIKIPSFQRRLRWSDDKKKQLLTSIDEGLPIGSLLVHAIPGKPYLLVDGQQRVTTIIESAQRPYSFLTPEFLLTDVFPKFAKSVGWNEKIDEHPKFLEAFSTWLNGDHPELIPATNLLQTQVKSLLAGNFTPFVEEIVTFAVSKANTSVRQRENYPIPVICYQGEVSDLPEIFERLNQRGTKLTKYEIYMATWENSGLIKPSNPLAADRVLEKFNAAQEFGIGVVNQHPGMLTLGEYLLTLGHEICDGRPKIFGDEYEETADAIAFQAACLALGLPLSGMEKLDQHLGRLFTPAGKNDGGVVLYSEDAIRGFRNSIMKAANFWEDVLAATRWDNAKHPIAHGSLVPVAMITAALLEARGADQVDSAIWSGSSEWPRSKDVSRIHSIALRRYVMALLTPELSRQYGKIQDLVWSSGVDGAQQRIPSRWFFTDPTTEQLTTVDAWWTNARVRPMGRNVSSLQKTLLSIVTKKVQPEKGIPAGKREVDHVVSWKIIDQNNWQSKFPVSSVSNLCLLDKHTNGTLKTAGSLDQLMKHPDIAGKSEEQKSRQAMIESNVFLADSVLKKDLLELDLQIHSDSHGAEPAFRDFLDRRWMVVKKLLMGVA